MNKCIFSFLALVFTMLLVSCATQKVPPMQRDYVDAVTNINQVDPYYRHYFRAQNGANYTLADQRRAYLAAMQTARTPVRASDYTRGVAQSRLASRKTSKAYRGKKMASRRAVAKRGAKAKRGTKAKSRRATASRRTARRGSRRRG